jgi:hypothetical protein
MKTKPAMTRTVKADDRYSRYFFSKASEIDAVINPNPVKVAIMPQIQGVISHLFSSNPKKGKKSPVNRRIVPQIVFVLSSILCSFLFVNSSNLTSP